MAAGIWRDKGVLGRAARRSGDARTVDDPRSHTPLRARCTRATCVVEDWQEIGCDCARLEFFGIDVAACCREAREYLDCLRMHMQMHAVMGTARTHALSSLESHSNQVPPDALEYLLSEARTNSKTGQGGGAIGEHDRRDRDPPNASRRYVVAVAVGLSISQVLKRPPLNNG